MNCGDIEENPGVLDQCYCNNNFVTNAVLGVRNLNVLLETRLIELLLMLEEAVIVFFYVLCYINCMEILTTNFYLVRSLSIEEKTYFITLIVTCHLALPRNRFTCAI